MAQRTGLDASEATAALREGSVERLQVGFATLVAAEAGRGEPDPRDAMISLALFIDCARRLSLDPLATLGPIAETGPDWYRGLFEAFVGRTDIELAAFGWSLVETPEGPAYRFASPAD